MNSENRQCQNCKQNFTIEPDDFAFYEKMKVPAPTWCPDCRLMRRLAWRNEKTFYRNNCVLCGKSVVTIYSKNKPYKIYCSSCWWSDEWDAKEFGKDFDFSRPFFEQFYELQLSVPRVALLGKNSINSEYTNHSNNNKNCYLTVTTFDSENVMYSGEIRHASQDICDCYTIENGGQKLYECLFSNRCYRCQYSMLLRDCTDCYYCYDCRGCSDCFLSSNLRNKKYYILNEPYTKEEYKEKMEEYKMGSFAMRSKLYDDYIDLIKNRAIHRFVTIEKSNNVSGDMIFNSKNAINCFETSNLENCKNIMVGEGIKDSRDSCWAGFKQELTYESHATIHSYNILFSHIVYDNNHLQYCDSCHNSQNLFGCVGVKKGGYMILNKQYTEAEYEILIEKIIEHMKKAGEYGEFFPPFMSPFGYNETVLNIHIPLTKGEALVRGYKWEDIIPGTYGKETLNPIDIQDDIKDISESICKEALRCESCSKNYNIAFQEFQFYQTENLPIPRNCPDCRYKIRFKLCPPWKLWHRRCMCAKNHPHLTGKCTNEFETSYAPDRPEIVYCESCYQQEVI